MRTRIHARITYLVSYFRYNGSFYGNNGFTGTKDDNIHIIQYMTEHEGFANPTVLVVLYHTHRDIGSNIEQILLERESDCDDMTATWSNS